MKAFLLLLALATLSAAQQVPHWSLPTHLRVFVSPVFSANERSKINSAIESWQLLLPDGLTMEFAGEAETAQTCQGCITVLRASLPNAKERGECEANHHNWISDYAIVRLDAHGGDFLVTMEHELGHALGLSHYLDSVMAPKVSHRRPAAQDAAALRVIYGIVPKLTRYAFDRVVIITDQNKTLTRRSSFTFDDRGERIETQITQTGTLKGVNEKFWRELPEFPIGDDVTAKWAKSSALKQFTVAWTDEQGSAGGLPWFAETEQPSGMSFPIEAIKVDKSRTITVRFYNYRLFRVSVAIKELEF